MDDLLEGILFGNVVAGANISDDLLDADDGVQIDTDGDCVIGAKRVVMIERPGKYLIIICA